MLKNSYWANFDRPLCYPTHCNCEPYVDDWVVQPSATFSSLPIIILGLWIIITQKNKLNSPIISFGLVITTIGFASTIAHGTFTDLGLHFDFYAIILCISWVGSYCFISKSTWTFKNYFMCILVSLLSFLTVFSFQKARIYLCIIYFFVTFIIWIKWFKSHRKSKYNFIISFTILTIAALFFYVDENKIWCAKSIWVMGHSLWHYGVCTSLYFAYRGFTDAN